MANTEIEIGVHLHLGPCCNCGTLEGVTTVVMLPWTAPVADQGWGCAVCGLPLDGAVAVLCGACALDGGGFKSICVGYPGAGERMPVEAWKPRARSFEHDKTKHGPCSNYADLAPFNNSSREG